MPTFVTLAPPPPLMPPSTSKPETLVSVFKLPVVSVLPPSWNRPAPSIEPTESGPISLLSKTLPLFMTTRAVPPLAVKPPPELNRIKPLPPPFLPPLAINVAAPASSMK